jgi:phosphoglycerate kinase
MDKKTVRDVEIRGKVILVRADYNVPIDEAGVITDDLRIRESLPTLKYLLENDAMKVVVISHLGRPEGQRVESMSLAPVAARLSELMTGVEVNFVPYTVGLEVSEVVEAMEEGSVLLLENLRFSPLEEEDSVEFAQEIVNAVKPELFVQDGFGVVHRAHASTSAICSLVPSVAGLLLEKELVNLTVAQHPESPSLAIIGGAKVEDKAPLIERFAGIYDTVAVGGKIAKTYTSELPNVVVATDFVYGEDGVTGFDIGPESAGRIAELASAAKTVLWNGVLGMVEDERYRQASNVVAEAVGRLDGATTVIAGGDTTAFVEEAQRAEPELHYSLISTGGGAALEFLLGEKLPGVEALEDK